LDSIPAPSDSCVVSRVSELIRFEFRFGSVLPCGCRLPSQPWRLSARFPQPSTCTNAGLGVLFLYVWLCIALYIGAYWGLQVHARVVYFEGGREQPPPDPRPARTRRSFFCQGQCQRIDISGRTVSDLMLICFRHGGWN
jgi:hypothetical protein